MNFIVYNAAGEILRTGKCHETLVRLQAGEGEFVMEGVANDSLHSIDVKTGKILDRPPVEPQKPDYRVLRARAYPPMQEQLDALWKGGEDAEAMRLKIIAVKEQIPKEPA